MKNTIDAPHASGELVRAMVEIQHSLDELSRDIAMVRGHLEVRRPDEKVGVRILSCMLTAAVLQERLIQMQIIAVGNNE